MSCRSVGWVLAAASCAVAWSAPAYAGPWTRSRGEHYVKLSELYFASDTYVDATGARVQGTDYRAWTTAAYLELGLGERFHLQAFVPWALTRNAFDELDARYANVGFGDALVGVQTTPVELGLPWALRAQARLPLYDVAAIEGPSAELFPALGDGQVDVTLWGSVGASFWPVPAFVLLELGWRRRTGWYYGEGSGRDFRDGAALLAQAGYTWRERLLMAVNVNGVWTPAQDTITQSFLTVGPALGLELGGGWMLEAGLDPMVWSRNNSPGTTYHVGLSHRSR